MANGRGGARPGAGRKSKAEEFGLAALLDECWPVDDRRECIRVLSGLSRKGDLTASQLLMSYAYGKPTQPYEDLTRRTAEELAEELAATIKGAKAARIRD